MAWDIRVKWNHVHNAFGRGNFLGSRSMVFGSIGSHEAMLCQDNYLRSNILVEAVGMRLNASRLLFEHRLIE